MHFSFFLAFFTLISFAAALPTGHALMRASCDIAGCVAALAPTVVACVAAAAEGGANLLVDAACLAAAANDALNLPSDCDQCLEEFNVRSKAQSAVDPAVEEDSDTNGAESDQDRTEDERVDDLDDEFR